MKKEASMNMNDEYDPYDYSVYFAYKTWDDVSADLGKLVRSMEDPKFDDGEIDQITHLYRARIFFEILCSRMEDNESDMEEHTDLAEAIYNKSKSPNVHCVWDTLDSFIGTICKYDHAYLFGNTDLLSNLNILITKDYLNGFLLAPKPTPTDIDEDAWSKMASRLIDKTDEMNRQARKSGNDVVIFSEVMSQALSGFFNENAEELVFFETVGDLLNTFNEEENYAHYHSGMLDVRSFDLLREYGIPFAKPLFERSIDDMRNAPFRTDWRTIEHD